MIFQASKVASTSSCQNCHVDFFFFLEPIQSTARGKTRSTGTQAGKIMKLVENNLKLPMIESWRYRDELDEGVLVDQQFPSFDNLV